MGREQSYFKVARGQSHATNMSVEALYIATIFSSEKLETSGILQGRLGGKEGQIRGYGYRCHSNATSLRLNFLTCKMETKSTLQDCIVGIKQDEVNQWFSTLGAH